MNLDENSLQPLKNRKTITSREIAELTGKKHAHLMRDIRKMEKAWFEVTESKFGLSEYTDPTGRKLPQYELTKTESFFVATKFNDVPRAKLVLRWEQLELQNLKTPQTFSDALLLAYQQAKQIEEQALQLEQKDQQLEQKDQQIEQKENLLQEQKPKVMFAEAVETSHTSILIGELAKLLKQNGINIGQNRLFTWLRDNGYLINRFSDFNMPTQKSMELKLFKIKEIAIKQPNGKTIISKTPKVTGKGQTYFINLFLSKKIDLFNQNIK